MEQSIAWMILMLVVGLALILAGANYMTDGSVVVARRFNISGFVIGLTVVAIGTSMPEMVVSVISALKGSTDISIGNVVGSNIFNVLMILGLCAAVKPIMLTQLNVYRDIPMGVGASFVMLVMTFNGEIGRLEGAIMLVGYFALMIYTLRNSRPSKEEMAADAEAQEQNDVPMWLSLVMLFGGLGALIYGGSIFIENATQIAYYYGIPENVIAVTLVAGGTSLPEFAAALVSMIKGKSDIALGNVVGSNIANILLVLGFSSTLTPLTMGSITLGDVAVVLLSAVLLFVTAFTFGKRRIDRGEGVIMVLVFVAYMYWVLTKSPVIAI